MTLDSRTGREQLEQFFTPELAARLAHDSAPLQVPLRKARPEFILTLVRDDDPIAAVGRLKMVVDLVVSAGGVIEAIAGSLVVVTFDSVGETALSRDDLETRRRGLVAKLSDALQQDVVIVHGAGDGLVGLVGGDRRLHYGTLFGGFSRFLKVLCGLRWGDVTEWRSEMSPE